MQHRCHGLVLVADNGDGLQRNDLTSLMDAVILGRRKKGDLDLGQKVSRQPFDTDSSRYAPVPAILVAAIRRCFSPKTLLA